MQRKFSAIEAPRKGLIIPAEGVGGSWIVKLPAREFEGVPENEYAMMTLAGLVGIDVPAVRLVDVREIGHLPDGMDALRGQPLAVHRFDRLPDGTPVHMEDFAQIFGVYPDNKYKKASYMNIASVIAAESNDDDIAELIRRLTFSALIGNADMHLKNLSMLYPDKRNAVLAPAYDLVSTILYIPDERAALKVSRTRRFDEFSEDELRHLAARARVPEKLVLDAALQTVEAFHQHWQAEKKNLPLSAAAIARIEAHAATFPSGRNRRRRSRNRACIGAANRLVHSWGIASPGACCSGRDLGALSVLSPPEPLKPPRPRNHPRRYHASFERV